MGLGGVGKDNGIVIKELYSLDSGKESFFSEIGTRAQGKEGGKVSACALGKGRKTQGVWEKYLRKGRPSKVERSPTPVWGGKKGLVGSIELGDTSWKRPGSKREG